MGFDRGLFDRWSWASSLMSLTGSKEPNYASLLHVNVDSLHRFGDRKLRSTSKPGLGVSTVQRNGSL